MAKFNISSAKSKAIQEIAKIKPQSGAKTGIGRLVQSRRNQSLKMSKIRAMKDLGQSNLAKSISAASGLAQSIVAQETAKDLANARNNSYKAGLAAWMKNISGNPNPSDGSEGSTQSGTTSELGG